MAYHLLPKSVMVTSLAALWLLTTSLTLAGTAAPKNPALAPPPPAPLFNALLQLDFSDHYITPRGLNVENNGLIFQPLFLVFWDLYSDDNGFLQDVTLTTGVWSSFHTRESGVDPGHWNEFDPIAGLGLKFADNWKLDLNYTAFRSMVDAYPTSHHLEVKLSYDDSKLLGAFALKPFIAFWKELENKATVAFNPATSEESYYFTLGINPSFKAGPVKFEFPTYINWVDGDFYQKFDGSGGGSGVAVFGTELKVSVPLTFVPKDLGFWSLYAGVRYYHLSNDGLRDGNSVLTADGDKDNLVQFHGGISIFF
jgi:hypothetical protein